MKIVANPKSKKSAEPEVAPAEEAQLPPEDLEDVLYRTCDGVDINYIELDDDVTGCRDVIIAVDEEGTA